MRFAPEVVALVADPYPVYDPLRRDAPVLYAEAIDHRLVAATTT